MNKELLNISSLTIHRLLVSSLMIAVKYFDDVYYSNAFYAQVGGVSTKEINTLEYHFLSMVSWNLYVPPDEYEKYRYMIEGHTHHSVAH